MYKVQIEATRPGYKRLRLEGVYIPSKNPGLSVPEMKKEVLSFMRRKLIERNQSFETFKLDITVFKKLKTDFLYNPGNSEIVE